MGITIEEIRKNKPDGISRWHIGCYARIISIIFTIVVLLIGMYVGFIIGQSVKPL